MVGSKLAGVSPVMSLMISSSRYPTASRAAIFAIGNPVALLASALERDTRGFISMTTISPFGRVQRELDVRAAGVDTDAPDARERGVAHALVLDVGERLRPARR